MGLLSRLIRVVFFAALFAVSVEIHAQAYIPGEVIVKLKSEAGSQGSFAFLGKAHGEKQMNLKQSFGKMGVYHFEIRKGQTVEEAVAELKADPDVEYAEPNYILKKAADVVGMSQTLSAIEAQQYVQAGSYDAAGIDSSIVSSWSFTSNLSADTRPIVAIIDTGVDVTHTVFTSSDAIWINEDEIPSNGIDDDGNGYVDDVKGWNFVDNSGLMYDDDDHGTHVAGIVLSVDQDIYNAPFEPSKIRIMPLKFLDGNGVGSTSNAIKAIYYAVNNGATVLNNSWGGPTYSAALHEAIAFSYSRGVSFVAAAGNSGENNDVAPMYPASYDVPNVVSVAATHNTWSLTTFSNYGKSTVDIGARGYFILSTVPGGFYANSSGTSMAAPFVSGTLIQMKVQSPSMLGYQLKSLLLGQSVYQPALATKVVTDGRLESANAINSAQTAVVETSQPAYNGSFSGNRELASSLAGGGGCGLVAKLGKDHFGGRGGGGSGSAPHSWYVLLLLALLAAPIFLATYLRQRNPANRRKHERFKINSDVRVKFGDRELVGSVSSISLGGVQINTEAWLEQGGIVNMSISSPDGREQIQVEGKIVWSEANKAYGVAFSHAPQSALERISNWTSALVKSAS